jgi:hypothetical protein
LYCAKSRCATDCIWYLVFCIPRLLVGARGALSPASAVIGNRMPRLSALSALGCARALRVCMSAACCALSCELRTGCAEFVKQQPTTPNTNSLTHCRFWLRLLLSCRCKYKRTTARGDATRGESAVWHPLCQLVVVCYIVRVMFLQENITGHIPNVLLYSRYNSDIYQMSCYICDMTDIYQISCYFSTYRNPKAVRHVTNIFNIKSISHIEAIAPTGTTKAHRRYAIQGPCLWTFAVHRSPVDV